MPPFTIPLSFPCLNSAIVGTPRNLYLVANALFLGKYAWANRTLPECVLALLVNMSKNDLQIEQLGPDINTNNGTLALDNGTKWCGNISMTTPSSNDCRQWRHTWALLMSVKENLLALPQALQLIDRLFINTFNLK